MSETELRRAIQKGINTYGREYVLKVAQDEVNKSYYAGYKPKNIEKNIGKLTKTKTIHEIEETCGKILYDWLQNHTPDYPYFMFAEYKPAGRMKVISNKELVQTIVTTFEDYYLYMTCETGIIMYSKTQGWVIFTGVTEKERKEEIKRGAEVSSVMKKMYTLADKIQNKQ